MSGPQPMSSGPTNTATRVGGLAFRGSAINLVASVISASITLATQLPLALLLFPRDFGLFALASTVSGVLSLDSILDESPS